jgi:hypothetical protein
MSSLPIDIASRVSPELSSVIEARVNDPDADQPVTLWSVRVSLAEGGLSETREADRLHFDGNQSLIAELDALIEQFGPDALAIDFVAVKASEQLSRVIDAAMQDPDIPPTLAAVREAMNHGLVARLVGEGAIDPDEDETLLAEIDGLIERFGGDADAEAFVRYE